MKTSKSQTTFSLVLKLNSRIMSEMVLPDWTVLWLLVTPIMLKSLLLSSPHVELLDPAQKDGKFTMSDSTTSTYQTRVLSVLAHIVSLPLLLTQEHVL